jgi:Fic family protein
VVSTTAGFHAFVPAPLPPRLEASWDVAVGVADADRALGELVGVARQLVDPRLLLGSLVRREAVLSSRIEGSRASLTDLVRFEAGDPPPDIPREEILEVANYARCLDRGAERLNDLPVSLRWICELHATLLEDTRHHHLTPGVFRRSQNWIGPAGSTPSSATYVPPPVDEMHACLHELERFLHERSSLPSLIRAALVHYQFEAIHPFLDGNGRVGRLLIPLLLHAEGRIPLPVLHASPFIERRRSSYYEGLLRVSQRAAWKDWILFFLEAVEVTSKEALEGCQRLLDLQAEFRALVSGARAPASTVRLVDALFGAPFMTIPGAARILGVTHRAARMNVERLVDLGIVEEIDTPRRRRVFLAPRILAALDRRADQPV